jgi:hypothetical protein
MDNLDDHAGVMLWSTIQPGLAIICSCLPTFGPLISAFMITISYARSWYASVQGRLRLSYASRTQQNSEREQDDAPSNWIKIGEEQVHAPSQNWVQHDHSVTGSEFALGPVPKAPSTARSTSV